MNAVETKTLDDMNTENFCFVSIGFQNKKKINSINMKFFILITAFVVAASALPRKKIFFKGLSY